MLVDCDWTPQTRDPRFLTSDPGTGLPRRHELYWELGYERHRHGSSKNVSWSRPTPWPSQQRDGSGRIWCLGRGFGLEYGATRPSFSSLFLSRLKQECVRGSFSVSLFGMHATDSSAFVTHKNKYSHIHIVVETYYSGSSAHISHFIIVSSLLLLVLRPEKRSDRAILGLTSCCALHGIMAIFSSLYKGL